MFLLFPHSNDQKPLSDKNGTLNAASHRSDLQLQSSGWVCSVACHAHTWQNTLTMQKLLRRLVILQSHWEIERAELNCSDECAREPCCTKTSIDFVCISPWCSTTTHHARYHTCKSKMSVIYRFQRRMHRQQMSQTMFVNRTSQTSLLATTSVSHTRS